MPGGAAVDGLEEPAVGPVEFVVVLPRAFTRLPHRGVDDVGIRRIDLDIGPAGVLVLGNDSLPGFSTVGRAIDSTFFTGAIRVAEHGSKNTIGIARIDGQRGNLLSVDEAAEMSPGFAGVGGLVDAVADGEIGAVQSLAAADIDDVGVRRSDGNGSDGLSGFVIEDGVPGATVVVGFPNAAVYLGDVEHIGLAGNAGGRAGAPATKRADHAPVQFLVGVFGN